MKNVEERYRRGDPYSIADLITAQYLQEQNADSNYQEDLGRTYSQRRAESGEIRAGQPEGEGFFRGLLDVFLPETSAYTRGDYRRPYERLMGRGHQLPVAVDPETDRPESPMPTDIGQRILFGDIIPLLVGAGAPRAIAATNRWTSGAAKKAAGVVGHHATERSIGSGGIEQSKLIDKIFNFLANNQTLRDVGQGVNELVPKAMGGWVNRAPGEFVTGTQAGNLKDTIAGVVNPARNIVAEQMTMNPAVQDPTASLVAKDAWKVAKNVAQEDVPWNENVNPMGLALDVGLGVGPIAIAKYAPKALKAVGYTGKMPGLEKLIKNPVPELEAQYRALAHETAGGGKVSEALALLEQKLRPAKEWQELMHGLAMAAPVKAASWTRTAQQNAPEWLTKRLSFPWGSDKINWPRDYPWGARGLQ